jgi:hypothetical protein
MADKSDWCDANLRHFIDIIKGEIAAGNRPMDLLTSAGWKNLRAQYEEKTTVKQIKKQLKNKLDNMKKEYTWYMEFKNCATRLGWNETKQNVECFDEWWTEHLTISISIMFIIFSIHFSMLICSELQIYHLFFRDAMILAKASTATM